MRPEAGEAAITRRTQAPANARHLPPPDDPERRLRNDVAHAARARSHVRRYCRANRCRFLWTLTFADATLSYSAACDELSAFLRRLREYAGRIPVVAVAEPHPGGHGWHWHLATDRFLRVEVVRRLWGNGHVWVGDPRHLKGRVPPRKLAAYLAKYLGKEALTAGDAGAAAEGDLIGRERGQHRYRLTPGFAPGTLRLHFRTAQAAYTCLHLLYGQHDRYSAFSAAGDGVLDSWWFGFPDECLHPPPLVQ